LIFPVDIRAEILDEDAKYHQRRVDERRCEQRLITAHTDALPSQSR
jgi:hypothetical protein